MGVSNIRKPVSFVLIAVLLCMAISVFTSPGSTHAAKKSLDWNTRQILWHPFANGLREARHTGKPVFIVFYAEWCSHCALYSRQFHDPRVVKLSKSMVMVRVDVDEYPDIAERYTPDGGYVPRTMVLRPNGSLITSIHGPQGQYRYFLDDRAPGELIGFMRQAAELNSAPR